MSTKMIIGILGVGFILFVGIFFIFGIMDGLAESEIRSIAMIGTPTLEIYQGRTSEFDIVINTEDKCILKGNITVNFYKTNGLVGTGKMSINPNQINFIKDKNTIKNVFVTGLDNKMTADQVDFVINTTDGRTFTSEKLSFDIAPQI